MEGSAAFPYLYILYLLIWRLSVILCGALSIYLGFRLFELGFDRASSEIEAKGGVYGFSFRNFAPGTAFALFGAVLIGTMVVFSPAEIRLEPSAHGQDGTASGQGGLIFRGDGEESE